MDRSTISFPICPNLKNHMKRESLVVQIWYLDKSLKTEDFMLLYPDRVTPKSAMRKAELWFQKQYSGYRKVLKRTNLYSGYLIDGVRVLNGIEEREEEEEDIPWN